MKYLKDLEMNQLKIQELMDYTEMEGVDLDKEIKTLLETGVENLYKKYVPAKRREMIDFKIKKATKDNKKISDKPEKTNTNQPTKTSSNIVGVAHGNN